MAGNGQPTRGAFIMNDFLRNPHFSNSKDFFRGTMNCLTHALQPCSKLKGEIYICSGLVQSVSSAVAAIHNEVELFGK